MRHGLPAGISTGLAFSAGALTNVFTQGWSWPVGVGLGVLAVGWVGWEMRPAALRHEPAGGYAEHGRSVGKPKPGI
jgi:hypothetical protein